MTAGVRPRNREFVGRGVLRPGGVHVGVLIEPAVRDRLHERAVRDGSGMAEQVRAALRAGLDVLDAGEDVLALARARLRARVGA